MALRTFHLSVAGQALATSLYWHAPTFTLVADAAPWPANISIAATSATKDEGDSGSTAYTFTVTRSNNTVTTCSAIWTVTGSGAAPANAADFTGGAFPTGVVTFATGETSKVITVNVAGDATDEAAESFTVTLSNPVDCTITGATATGTIQNDDAPLSSIAADGWQATVSSPTDLSFTSVSVARAGYDATGAATTHADTLYLTKRVRQVYPNHASLTTDRVALSEYVYDDDTISGATNSSTQTSPKSICRWVMPQRMVVGGTFHWEIVAFHLHARNGKPVACVKVRATNGTNSTSWQTVTAPTVSTYIEDPRDTAVYQGDLDTSGLPDGLYWLEAEVYPWVGVAASVRTSDNSTSSLRAFGKRWFTKDSTLASTPPYVYVASTGNDSTGVCSTTAATAAASPCLTVTGALVKAAATLGSGKIDGLIIRVVDTVALGTTPASNLNQASGAVIVERAPGTARASAIVQQSASRSLKIGLTGLDASLSYGSIIFKDMTFQRTASGQLGNGGTPRLHIQLWNCSVDNGSITGNWGATDTAVDHYGVVWTNNATNTFSYSLTQVQYTFRGVTATLGGSYEGGCVVGCQWTSPGAPNYADPMAGAVWYNSAFLSPSATNAPIQINSTNAGEDITGVAFVQCFVEPTHTTSTTPAFRPSSDGTTGNIVHGVFHHNVSLGSGILGRWNVCYDEATVARTHKFVSMKGNVAPQINIKGDIFHLDGTRIGNFPLVHGVACRGNFTKYAVNSTTSEAQFYPGIASNIGTSTTVLNDPEFVDDKGTSFNGSTYSAGAGGSDVHPDTGSPLIGIVDELLLSHDFEGTARSGTQDAGLYA